MAGKLVLEERVTIPLDLDNLAAFRSWALSDEFPEEGRIDFVDGHIEVELAPDDLFTHGTVKTEFVVVLGQRAKTSVPGDLFTDRTRISSVPGNVSAEPDIVFLSEECLRAGRVRLVPKAGAKPDRYVEIDGAPDLVVEFVSDASVGKDTRRLPRAYFRAGVSEYWLVDARGDEVEFTIHQRGAQAFEAVPADDDGFQRSGVFRARFRVERERRAVGGWRYQLSLAE
ncbi:MAG: Uma2 family endonuclease [Planctomycetota bacterium]|nr:Uma2 family endonuclease [Planctomycetota bacterium]